LIKSIIIASLLLLLPSLSKGDINYFHSGYANATTVNRLSDGSIIKMPYRILSYEPVLSSKNINIVANTALEFRLKDISQIMDSDLKVDIRELYIEWMTPLGDFSFGKQIISWGSASENNPTDNISPYNYYYLFSMGKERKEGIFSLNSTIYYQNFKLNAIFIPEHNPNTLPLNDPEFSLSIPIIPTDEQIMELENPYEYALSLQFPLNNLDITTSHFSGYDRIVSFFGANVWANQAFTEPIVADTVLSYRKTEMFGIGLSFLFSDFAFRSDLGYFITNDNVSKKGELYRYYELGAQLIIEDCKEKNAEVPDGFFQFECEEEPTHKETFLLNNFAKYLQYTLEVEFNPTSEFNIITQYSKNKSTEFGEADSLTLSTTILMDPEVFFIPGIGSPNTFISSNSLSISARKLFPDMGLEFSYTSMFDLDKKGSLHGAGLEYAIFNNTNLLVEVTKIFNNDQIQMNPFTAMKDFSRILFEIRYFY